MPPTFNLFQVNTQALEQLAHALPIGAQAGLDAAWKVLQVWGQDWKHDVERVSPVESGLMRQSWFLMADRTDTQMSITLANSIKGKNGYQPYPFYLEFGTDRIAGGRVKAWQVGDTPIMSWPAKSAELPMMPRFGTAAYARYEDTLSHAFSAGSGEQMPMIRPIAYQNLPKLVEDFNQALVQGFQAVVTRRRSGG